MRDFCITTDSNSDLPLEYIEKHGIRVFNAEGVYSIPMAEFAVGGILQIYKQSGFFYENKKDHRWEKHRGLRELVGKTVLIIGTGHVGLEIAKRLMAFGCTLIGVNRTAQEKESFDQVLPLERLQDGVPEADILIVSIALAENTEYLLDKSVFDRMKDDAVLVNVSRGKLVKETDLYQWLIHHPDAGAVLDVFEEEPLTEENPLWEMENVIVSPHNSFVGENNSRRLEAVLIRNLQSLSQ